MDYKKLYRDALERAKKVNKGENVDVESSTSLCEYIFPELAESEDERIREELIDAIQGLWDNDALPLPLSVKRKDAWIAWLEKQKEYESTDFEYVWDRTDCGDLTSALDKYSEEAIINMCHAWYDKGIELERKSWLEKQGDKDKLIKELGEYKVKYTQEVLEKHLNSMNNKDSERLRKTTIAFLKEFADKGYENAAECIDWLEKQDKDKQIMKGKSATEAIREEKVDNANKQGEQKPFDYENATITQKDFAPKGLTDSQYLDRAVCFIAAREDCNDYICSKLYGIKDEREICTKDCQGGLDRICVLRFLKYYKEGGEE